MITANRPVRGLNWNYSVVTARPRRVESSNHSMATARPRRVVTHNHSLARLTRSVSGSQPQLVTTPPEHAMTTF